MKTYLALLMLAAGALAQQADTQPTPPADASAAPGPTALSPHIQNPLPDGTKWVVKTEAPSRAGRLGGVSAKTGKKIGGIVYTESSQANGVRSETWGKGEVRVVITAGAKEPLVLHGVTGEDAYKDIEWIFGMEDEGTTEVGGRKCVLFRKSMTDPAYIDRRLDTVTADAPTIDLRAFVDAETHLPVQSKNADASTSSYAFEKIPEGESLAIPPDVEAIFRQEDEAAKAAAERAARP